MSSADQVANFIRRAIAPLQNRVMLMIGRAVITAVKNDKTIQELQLSALDGESLDNIQRFQEFGFCSVPPANSEAIMVALGGNRAAVVVIATENRKLRPTDWEVGESGFYNEDGAFAVLRKGGFLEVKNESEELVTVLSDALQAIIDSRNITAIGPQPMTPESVLALTEIKERLDTFKKV